MQITASGSWWRHQERPKGSGCGLTESAPQLPSIEFKTDSKKKIKESGVVLQREKMPEWLLNYCLRIFGSKSINQLGNKQNRISKITLKLERFRFDQRMCLLFLNFTFFFNVLTCLLNNTDPIHSPNTATQATSKELQVCSDGQWDSEGATRGQLFRLLKK